MLTATHATHPMTAFTVRSRYSVLKLRMSQARWYGPAVTKRSTRTPTPAAPAQTLASQIRELAAERGYADAESYQAVPLEVRQGIAGELEIKLNHVNSALSRDPSRQGKGGGAKRVHTDRCPCCEQALLTQGAHEALARNHSKKRVHGR